MSAEGTGARRQRRRPNRNRQQRRAPQRPRVAAERPVDYSQDYAAVRRELYRIAIWSGLLFVGMFAAFFVL
jgi:hypothetical protein